MWISQALDANADHFRIDEIGRSTIAALQAGTWPPSCTGGEALTTEITRLLAQFGAVNVRKAAPADPLARRQVQPLWREHCTRDVTVGLLPEWLGQNDRNAMRSGVENRSPFLDLRLMTHLGMGYRTKFNGPWKEHELRQLFDSFRPGRPPNGGAKSRAFAGYSPASYGQIGRAYWI